MDKLPPAQRQSLNTILDNCKQQGGRIKLLLYKEDKVRIEIVDDTGFVVRGFICPCGSIITQNHWPKKAAEGKQGEWCNQN